MLTKDEHQDIVRLAVSEVLAASSHSFNQIADETAQRVAEAAVASAKLLAVAVSDDSKKLASIETTVTRMESRLFGNGQPGVIKLMQDDIGELKTYKTTANTFAKVFSWVVAAAFTVLAGVLTSHLINKVH